MTTKLNTDPKRKAAVTSCCNLKGHFLETVSTTDYSAKALEKQLDSSGAVEKLAADLTNYLSLPRKVVKCVRCAGCGKPYAPHKMSILYPICRNCLGEVREKGAQAQSNFINRTVNNFQIFLKGALTTV